jgi:hypothetical protein
MLLAVALATLGCGGDNNGIDMTVPDMALPAPNVLGQAQTLTSCLALDDTSIYWADDGNNGSILKVAKTGGNETSLVSGGVDRRACAALDAANVYYTSNGGTTVNKADKNLGGGVQLTTGEHVIGPLASDGTYVYWVTDVYGNVDAFNGMNALVRFPVSGAGSVEVVYGMVNGNCSGLVVTATTYFISDGAGVYAIDKTTAARIDYNMGSTVVLHNSVFAVNNANLVLTEVTGFSPTDMGSTSQGDVAMYRLDGNGRKTLSNTLASLLTFDTDGSGLFAKQQNLLVHIPLDGSGPKPFGPMAPRAIAVDATYVYWTDGVSILSLLKHPSM